MAKRVVLSRKQIYHIADLSKLILKGYEVEKYRRQLSEIISYINELSKVETKYIQPTSQTTDLKSITMIDRQQTKDKLDKSLILSQSKKTYSGYFIVPLVLEEKAI